MKSTPGTISALPSSRHSATLPSICSRTCGKGGVHDVCAEPCRRGVGAARNCCAVAAYLLTTPRQVRAGGGGSAVGPAEGRKTAATRQARTLSPSASARLPTSGRISPVSPANSARKPCCRELITSICRAGMRSDACRSVGQLERRRRGGQVCPRGVASTGMLHCPLIT